MAEGELWQGITTARGKNAPNNLSNCRRPPPEEEKFSWRPRARCVVPPVKLHAHRVEQHFYLPSVTIPKMPAELKREGKERHRQGRVNQLAQASLTAAIKDSPPPPSRERPRPAKSHRVATSTVTASIYAGTSTPRTHGPLIASRPNVRRITSPGKAGVKPNPSQVLVACSFVTEQMMPPRYAP